MSLSDKIKFLETKYFKEFLLLEEERVSEILKNNPKAKMEIPLKILFANDVKEFIRELKKHYLKHLNKHFKSVSAEHMEEIDKLAGEKLIK